MSQITGAAGQIEHAVSGAQAAEFEGKTFPQSVNAERHDVVHQVVTAGYRIKKRADAALFVVGEFPP